MPPSWASRTLRLPKSSLPPRAIPGDHSKYLKRVTSDLYAWQKLNCTGRFILHDGPPYANGDLHIGHALNKILKDITCRYQVLQGRRIEFRPGWDCHGLPIELKALQKQKELGKLKDGQSLDPIEIRKVARELASKTVETQKASFQEWAIMADWDNSWRTMDKDYEIRQLEIFKLMVGNGQIYRRLKPVYWSPSSKTALAEAELEYNSDHRSTAAYVKFAIYQLPQAILDILPPGETSVAAAVWTTTPWTLPANRAIAVGRVVKYAVVQTTAHGILIVASSRLAECETFAAGVEILGTITGADLIGLTYKHPFRSESNGPQPIFHADFVTDESGTGLVHIAPGHGMDDYKLCQSHNIQPFAPLDDAGCFTSEAFSGSNILEGKPVLTTGNKAVLEILQADSMLIATHKYRHKYPYDWRSKQPVIIRATAQWFADLGGIRDKALQALEAVKFIPASGYDRISSFVKGRSEWCISRQRAWGVPIPALYDKNGEAVLTPESITHIISVIQKRGIDAWWSDSPTDPAWIAPCLQDKGPFTRCMDTMDVWFDSGTSWSQIKSVTSSNTTATADVYLEGTDQHRGWFQSSLLTKVAQLTALGVNAVQAPFKTLITHGFTLDQHGKKMSKSEGNVISPTQIMDGTLLPPLKKQKGSKVDNKTGPIYDGMGTDALRLWAASSDFTRDIVVSESVLKAINGSLAKLRVTFKLLTGLLDTHCLKCKVDFRELGAIDQLAVLHSQRMRTEVDTAYQEFTYHRAAATINAYVNTNLSAFYIESIKDRCYVDAAYSKSRRHAQCVLWTIYRNLSHVLLPITPLLVAEVRDYLPLHLQSYDVFELLREPKLISIKNVEEDHLLEAQFKSSGTMNIGKIWDEIRRLQEEARSEKLMGSSLDCYVAIKLPSEHSNPDMAALVFELQAIEPELESLFVTSRAWIISSSQDIDRIKAAKWIKQASITPSSNPENTQESIDIFVYAPEHTKCVRCWKYTVEQDSVPDIKTDTQDTTPTSLEEPVCQRCLGVLEGQRDEDPEIFDGRPNIAKAAAVCRTLKDSDMYRWNWDLKNSD